MDFGINLATSSDSWKVVKRAEELGYARAWFYDTQMLNADMFVAMGAAAVQTSRIRLGTGVLIPSPLKVYPGAPHSFFDRKYTEFAEAAARGCLEAGPGLRSLDRALRREGPDLRVGIAQLLQELLAMLAEQR